MEVFDKSVATAEEAVAAQENSPIKSAFLLTKSVQLLLKFTINERSRLSLEHQITGIKKAVEYLGLAGQILATLDVKNLEESVEEISCSSSDSDCEEEAEGDFQLNKNNPFPTAKFIDIVGHEEAKQILLEATKWPIIYPDYFEGDTCTKPWSGILLFGPPGTAKTQLACAAANESGSNFVNISVSNMMSSYLGESEKKIRQLFEFAKENQPCIVFLDEVDSLMSKRNSQTSEDMLRVKAELLTQLTTAANNSKICVVGSTNVPDLFDRAFLRRFEQRLYIPLPNVEDRSNIIVKCLNNYVHTLNRSDVQILANLTYRFSGDDLRIVCKEAAMIAIRAKVHRSQNSGPPITGTRARAGANEGEPPQVSLKNLTATVKRYQPSTQVQDIRKFERMNKKYGKKRTRGEHKEPVVHSQSLSTQVPAQNTAHPDTTTPMRIQPIQKQQNPDSSIIAQLKKINNLTSNMI